MFLHAVACFIAGLFLCNAVPHFVSGVMGRPFPSPFSKPPGVGLSSPMVNVLWGWSNGVVGVGLVLLGRFELGWNAGAGCAVAAVLAMGMMHAWHFGKVMSSAAASGEPARR